MEKKELMEQIKRYEDVIDYDFWFITQIHNTVVKLYGKEVWENIINEVSKNLRKEY